MEIDTTYYKRCVQTLEKAFSLLQLADKSEIEYDLYRSACVKEFELILEQSGKLLKKVLQPFFHSDRVVHSFVFKDIFRQAATHQLISIEESARWLKYRDNRNSTAHDYGIGFAEETIQILPQFMEDAKNLALIIDQQNK